jgi:hypothetical protein
MAFPLTLVIASRVANRDETVSLPRRFHQVNWYTVVSGMAFATVHYGNGTDQKQ